MRHFLRAEWTKCNTLASTANGWQQAIFLLRHQHNSGASGRLFKSLEHGVLAISIKEFGLVDDEYLAMSKRRGAEHSAFVVAATTSHAAQHSLAQQFKRNVHLLAIA
jgi:hypothetical protein